jgi:uncharacterized surface protein with fasciclin (FAS1) repeats
MKKIISYTCILLLLAACTKKVGPGNPSRSSILQFIAQTPSLSLLDSAIGRVRLDTAMSSGGPYTFFAPSDSAFLQAGITLDSIQTMDPQWLLAMLEYEIVNGRISGADVPGFFKSQFSCLHPLYQPFVTKNYYGIFINGIPISNPDNELGDGVVQVTSRVAIPPVGSQLQEMQQSKDMLFFAALVHQVYFFGRLFSSPSPVFVYYQGVGEPASYGSTVLVPTDSAFKAFGYPDSMSLVNDSATLMGYEGNNGYVAGLLIPYIFSGFDFTSDFLGGIIMGPYADQNIGYETGNYESTANGMSFTGNGLLQANPPTIIGPDIMCSSGVIQKINQVFVPHD